MAGKGYWFATSRSARGNGLGCPPQRFSVRSSGAGHPVEPIQSRAKDLKMQTTRPGRAQRTVLISLGTLCVALGTIGIFVPGLPTTVFLLLASYLFARSSERLHRRLLTHPRLGAYLRMAQDRRMPLRAKVISVVAMWAGVSFALVKTANAAPALAPVLVVAAVVGTVVIVLLRPKEDAPAE